MGAEATRLAATGLTGGGVATRLAAGAGATLDDLPKGHKLHLYRECLRDCLRLESLLERLCDRLCDLFLDRLCDLFRDRLCVILY